MVHAYGPHEVAFAVRGPITAADLPGLCDRVCALLPGSGSVIACDVVGVPPDAVTVEALARLQLAARRRGCQVRLRNAAPALLGLVELMGLTHVLGDVRAAESARDEFTATRKSNRRRQREETAMRRIVNSTYITLDGVIEAPQDWPSTEGDEDLAYAIQRDLLFACDTVVMGRRTYEGFAPVWASRSGDEYSDRINSMQKVVVSSTLADPEWENTRVIAGDPIPQLRRLKETPGLDIVQYGFGQLSYALLENGLLDELRLWVHPFFVGKGGPADLLYRDSGGATLTLADTTVLASGIAVLTYAFDYPA